jgi:hypothetical protein
MTAVGAAAAAPVVGTGTAQAAGSNPAYTDAPNTFTADQTFNANVGIGTAPSSSTPLRVRNPGSDWAATVTGSRLAFVASHQSDLAGLAYDCVNVYHRGTGDGVYVAHLGGAPPSYTGPTGGNAGFNVLVPFNIDDVDGSGHSGNTVNDRRGMRGLFIQTQPPNDGVYGVYLQHHGNASALYIDNQNPAEAAPQGTGAPITVDDYSNRASIAIHKQTAPNHVGVLSINAPASIGAIDAMRVTQDGAVKVVVRNDGLGSFGLSNPFDIQLQTARSGAGIQRVLGLANPNSADGDGVQIEFLDGSSRYATVQGVWETRGSAASLRFNVLSRERLRVDQTGVGFFGVQPVARPSVVGSTNDSALRSLLTALSRLGLITDNTTASSTGNKA